eukprot:1159305-Pelagomonas_calceolata.AAC.6
MGTAEARRPLRSIQSAHIHCNPITSNFPLVKEKDYTSGNSAQKAKRPGELKEVCCQAEYGSHRSCIGSSGKEQC